MKQEIPQIINGQRIRVSDRVNSKKKLCATQVFILQITADIR